MAVNLEIAREIGMLVYEEVVYAFHAEGTDMYKIGTTRNLKARQSELQTGCPHKLTLIGYRDGGRELEFQIHDKFKEYRTRGEWFQIPNSHTVKSVFRNKHETEQVAALYLTELLMGEQYEFCTATVYVKPEGKVEDWYQLMPVNGCDNEFWDYYLVENRQYYSTKLEALATLIDAFTQWKEGKAR